MKKTELRVANFDQLCSAIKECFSHNSSKWSTTHNEKEQTKNTDDIDKKRFQANFFFERDRSKSRIFVLWIVCTRQFFNRQSQWNAILATKNTPLTDDMMIPIRFVHIASSFQFSPTHQLSKSWDVRSIFFQPNKIRANHWAVFKTYNFSSSSLTQKH